MYVKTFLDKSNFVGAAVKLSRDTSAILILLPFMSSDFNLLKDVGNSFGM